MRRILLFLICLASILFPRPSPAATWDYTIGADTPSNIDTAVTSATVDSTAHEIKLPILAPNSVAFWPDGSPDFVAIAPGKIIHYALDQVTNKYIELNVLDVPLSSDPLTVATSASYPDVMVTTKTGSYHYSFDGLGMRNNPALAAAGLTGCMAIGARDTDKAGIVGQGVQAYSLQGGTTQRDTSLEPASSLNNPIDVALFSDRRGMVVGEPDKLRYFFYTGTSSPEANYLNVLGLNGVKSVSTAENLRTGAIVGTQASEWQFDQATSSMKYIPVLAVTSGLNTPTAIALRPGSYDRIITDGDHLKYFRWNGSSLVYDTNLSVTVPGLSSLGSYASTATALSMAFDPGANSSYVRVRASHELPNNTSVTWSVTADGTNWTKKWRVRGTSGGTILEVSPDNGSTWNSAGTASDALPRVNNVRLWTQVPAGRSVKWKADLASTDPTVTPKVDTSPRGGVAVRIDTDAPPNPPTLPGYGACFTTTTPTLAWTFSDPDVGDLQSAYQIQVVRSSDLVTVVDSGKVISSANQYTVPSSTAPASGALWNSGTYQFKYRVMVWDQAGFASAWSSWADFCVAAFERPRIAQIVSPPSGQTAPDPTNPATHILITPGMLQSQLPLAKAGAKVLLVIDSVGPLTSITPVFPYVGNTATVNIPAKLPDDVISNPMYPVGNQVNRWCVEFWTDPDLSICPSGTVVQMQLSGTGDTVSATLNAPLYAEGIVMTRGSIYEDWFVVLQGRD